MASTKIQSVVQRQLPEFIREDYPKFTAFLKAYYEYMDTIDDRDIIELRDIDSTVDSFIDYFKGEIGLNVPNIEYMDMRLFLRKSKQAFTVKGTEESYKFLFRILFNKPVDIYYPWDQVLKPSDGKWKRDTSIFIKFDDIMEVVATDIIPGVQYRIIELGTTDFTECGAANNQLNTLFTATSAGVGTGIVTTTSEEQVLAAVNSMVGNHVTVTGPGKFVKVYVDRYKKIRTRVYELSIDKNYYGSIEMTDLIVYNNYSVSIAPTTIHYKILSPGKNYKVGDLIVGSTLANGVTIEQTIKVTKVSPTGGIVSIVPVKFGCGYTDNFYLLTTKQAINTQSSVSITRDSAPVFGSPETGIDQYVDSGTIVEPDYFLSLQFTGEGTISHTTSSNVVTGIDTKFLTSVKVGQSLYTNGTFIGYISAIASNTSLTLAANAAVNSTTGSYRVINTGVGTISTSTSDATVTGVGTSFLTSVNVGDYLYVNSTLGIVGRVASITNNTSLELENNATLSTSNYKYAISETYTNPTYAGTTLKTFYDTTVNNSIDMEDMALIDFVIGGVANYQGYYISNDGFLSDAIKIQDSKFYQKFSYVLVVDETIESYRSYIKSFLHSAGMAMYGEYQITNTYNPGVEGTFILKLGA